MSTEESRLARLEIRSEIHQRRLDAMAGLIALVLPDASDRPQSGQDSVAELLERARWRPRTTQPEEAA